MGDIISKLASDLSGVLCTREASSLKAAGLSMHRQGLGWNGKVAEVLC